MGNCCDGTEQGIGPKPEGRNWTGTVEVAAPVAALGQMPALYGEPVHGDLKWEVTPLPTLHCADGAASTVLMQLPPLCLDAAASSVLMQLPPLC